MLVLIGATPEGKKELVGFQTGVREVRRAGASSSSTSSSVGFEIGGVGDGALGFWKAIEEVFPGT
jgi:putative transposase